MSSELTYISAGKISNYTTADALKVDIVKTLARWYPNTYVFGDHALESWVLEAGGVYVLYGNSFQFELQQLRGNVYELTMYAIGRFRRHGSSVDYFERIFDGLEHQLGHPDREFATMLEAFSSKASEDWIDFGTPIQYTPSNTVLPVPGALAETVVYDEDDLDEENLFTTEDDGILEDDAESLEDDAESLDEDLDAEDEDEGLDEDLDAEDEESEDEDELIMSMPLHLMTDAQIEKYIELSGRCPRDEINQWTMVFRSGTIPRYSYVKFANVVLEDQHVSNITITRAEFLGTTFRNCVFEQVHFDECDFKSVIIENLTFNNCHFTECDLDPYMSVDNTCTVENYDYEEEMARERMEDNVTYRFC